MEIQSWIPLVPLGARETSLAWFPVSVKSVVSAFGRKCVSLRPTPKSSTASEKKTDWLICRLRLQSMISKSNVKLCSVPQYVCPYFLPNNVLKKLLDLVFEISTMIIKVEIIVFSLGWWHLPRRWLSWISQKPPPILVYSGVNIHKRINSPVWTQCGSFWTCPCISLLQRFTQSASVESQETDAPGVSPMNKRGPPPGEQEKKKTTFKVHRSFVCRSFLFLFSFVCLFVCLLGLGVKSSSRGQKLHCAGPWPRNFADRLI